MNPYSKYLENRDALDVLRETTRYLRDFAEKIGESGMQRSWAPGKWTANELVLHLIHVEFVHGNRIRYALTSENYAVQPFRQDAWVSRESASRGTENIRFLISLRSFNLRLFETITDEEKLRPVDHPELGRLNVGELLEILAGSDLNHRRQLEMIAAQQKSRPA